jgi:hypothetical protein
MENFLLQGVPQRVVIEFDHLRFSTSAINDCRRLAGNTQAAARTRTLL